MKFVRTVPARDWLNPRAYAARRVASHSLLGYKKLVNLWNLAGQVPDGAFVECGTWKGGSAAMLAQADQARDVWLFDSFQGLPERGPLDVSVDGHEPGRDNNIASENDVRRIFKKVATLEPHIVPGWFNETLPEHKGDIGPIALLHADGDWYESTRVILAELAPQVVPGGVIVVDDYGCWLGCKQATDEWLADHPMFHLGNVQSAHAWRV